MNRIPAKLRAVPDDESVLVVPLRSNARTLVAGGAVAAMRKRLKYASLFYDSLLLESGIFRVQAGPTGSSSFIVPPTAEDPPRWQTVAERRAATGATFGVAVSPDGAPDATPRAVVSSEAAISWAATFAPIRRRAAAGNRLGAFRQITRSRWQGQAARAAVGSGRPAQPLPGARNTDPVRPRNDRRQRQP